MSPGFRPTVIEMAVGFRITAEVPMMLPVSSAKGNAIATREKQAVSDSVTMFISCHSSRR